MTHYNSGDIVVVPFPFLERDISKPRPALILSSNDRISVLVMITTAISGLWEDDLEIVDLDVAGLPVTSYVRMKIFTLDTDIIKKKIGILGKKDTKNVRYVVKKLFTKWL